MKRNYIGWMMMAGAVMIIAASNGALAQDAERGKKAVEKLREKFDAADANHDGFLSRDEAAKGMPRVAKHFDEIDADHDGKVSMQEIAQFISAKRKARGK